MKRGSGVVIEPADFIIKVEYQDRENDPLVMRFLPAAGSEHSRCRIRAYRRTRGKLGDLEVWKGQRMETRDGKDLKSSTLTLYFTFHRYTEPTSNDQQRPAQVSDLLS